MDRKCPKSLIIPMRESLKVWKSTVGSMPQASTRQYAAAAAACSKGCPHSAKRGPAPSIVSMPPAARNNEARIPDLRCCLIAVLSPAPNAWEVRGSSAPTSPIIVTTTSHVVVPPREAAASALSPTCPTIRVSTMPIAINPSSTKNT